MSNTTTTTTITAADRAARRALRSFACSGDICVRLAVARDHHAPGDVLARFARSRSTELATAACANPSLPLEAMLRAADGWSRGWMGLLSNPAAPSWILEHLAMRTGLESHPVQ